MYESQVHLSYICTYGIVSTADNSYKRKSDYNHDKSTLYNTFNGLDHYLLLETLETD